MIVTCKAVIYSALVLLGVLVGLVVFGAFMEWMASR